MSTQIYLDNAATTPLDKQVLDAMLPFMTEHYGNPSSTYSKGRFTKIAIETARKSVAKLLGVKPTSIYFTSGGTESNNTAISAALRTCKCTTIITSPIEHHAVLHTVASQSLQTSIPVSFAVLHENGEIDYEDLEAQLQKFTGEGHKCLVSLMHANNEIGTLLNMKLVGELCKKYNAIFHSDCVQTVGHYPLDLSEIGVHFISGAGHKFHGPKGTGILYVNPSIQCEPLIYGGGQERNMRAGTENTYGIVGFAKALELAMETYEKESQYVAGLKSYMKEKLIQSIPGVGFNSPENSLYTVLSVCFPVSEESDSLLVNLDMEGICVSGGSACSSGSNYGSHVINALQKTDKCTTIRFSFSKYNTAEEIDTVVEVIKAKLCTEEPVLANSK